MNAVLLDRDEVYVDVVVLYVFIDVAICFTD